MVVVLLFVFRTLIADYRSCEDLKARTDWATTGKHVVYPHGAGAAGAVVFCDMDLADGNGWTIVHVATGADGDVGITSDVMVNADALWNHFNTPRAVKAALGMGRDSQILLYRSDSDWIVVFDCDSPVFSASFAGAGSESISRCSLESADGSQGTGVVGWSTGNSSAGGDFAVLKGATSSFDRAGAGVGAPFLNEHCRDHILYSESGAAVDGDAGYGSASSFGSWSTTTPGSCGDTSTEGGSLAFRVGVRAGRGGAWVPLLQDALVRGDRQYNQLGRLEMAFNAKRLRARYRDGHLTCGASTQGAGFPWNGCAPTENNGTAAGFSLDVFQNEEPLLTSASAVALPSACTVAAESPRLGPIVCDISFSGMGHETYSLGPHSAGGTGELRADVDVFVHDRCPLPATPLNGRTTGCVSNTRWMKAHTFTYTAQTNPEPVLVDFRTHSAVDVLQVRAVAKSGYLSCSDMRYTQYPWNACIHNGASMFELSINGKLLVETHPDWIHGVPDPQCKVAPPGLNRFGDVMCVLDADGAGSPVRTGPVATFTPGTLEARTETSTADNSDTPFVMELWTLVRSHEPGVVPTPASVATKRWHLLVDATIRAADLAHEVPWYSPDLGGLSSAYVSKVRAVPRSGTLACIMDTTELDLTWMWAACTTHHNHGKDGRTGGFDMRVNDEWVIKMPGWGYTDPRCTGPLDHQDQNIECDVNITLHADDHLQITWFENRVPIVPWVKDNWGTLEVDIWVLIEDSRVYGENGDVPFISESDVCTFACDPGFTMVGSVSRGCKSSGKWTGDAVRCLALAPFEASVLPSRLPSVHSWTFDSPGSARHVVDDVGTFGDTVGTRRVVRGSALVPLAGGSVVLAESQPQVQHPQLGCSVGRCALIASCGGGYRTESHLNTTALGGAHPKSISVWVRLPTAGRTGSGDGVVPLVSLGGSDNATGAMACDASFALALVDGVPTARLGRACGDGAGDEFLWPVPALRSALSPHKWAHVAVTFDGEVTRLFVAGQEAGRRVGRLATRAIPGSAADFITIGGDSSGWGDDAKRSQACYVAIDEVRVFAHALSQQELRELYTVGLRCPALKPPTLGSMNCSGSGTLPGDVCSFTCTGGYTPTLSTRTCEDGEWSGTPVTCARHTRLESASRSVLPLHAWTFDEAAAVSSTHGADPNTPFQNGGRIAFRDVGTAAQRDGGAMWLMSNVDTSSVSAVPHSPSTTGIDGIGSALHIHSAACVESAFLQAVGPLDESLQGAGSKSLSFWWKVESLSGNGDGVLPLVSFGGPRQAGDPSCTNNPEANCHGARFAVLHEGGAGGNVTASGYGGTAFSATSPTPTSLGSWMHVAAVYDHVDHTMSLFLDGTEVARATGVSLDTGNFTSDFLRVGGDTLVSLSTSTACDIYIDELKVYNRALSHGELSAQAQVQLGRIDMYGGNLFGAATTLAIVSESPVGPSEAFVAVTQPPSAPDNMWLHRDTSTTAMLSQSRRAAGNNQTLALAGRTTGPNATVILANSTEAVRLSVKVGVNHAFHCDSVARTCPVVIVSFGGSDAVVELELTEELIGPSRGQASALDEHVGRVDETVTLECRFWPPPTVSTIVGTHIEWNSQNLGTTRIRGSLNVFEVALFEHEPSWSPEDAQFGSTATMWASPSLDPSRLVCGALPTVLNDRASAPNSCFEIRQQALRGSSFVRLPPATHTQFQVQDLDGSGQHTMQQFVRPVVGAIAGDAVQVRVRAVDRVSLRPLRTDSGQVVHISAVSCTTGEVRRASSGTWTSMASLSFLGIVPANADGLDVLLQFDARVDTGSDLDWRIIDLQSNVNAVAASGTITSGTLPASGSACSDSTLYCRFVATWTASEAALLAAKPPGSLHLQLRPSLPAVVVVDASRGPDRVLYLRRVGAFLGTVAPLSADAAVETSGDAWTVVGSCFGPTAAGGLMVEYTAYIDAGPALWQVDLLNRAVVDLQSGPYWVDPNGGAVDDAVLAHCDHDTDGGGWTLVSAWSGTAGAIPHVAWDDAVPGMSPFPWFVSERNSGYAMGQQARHLTVQEKRVVASAASVESKHPWYAPQGPVPTPDATDTAVELWVADAGAGAIKRRRLGHDGGWITVYDGLDEPSAVEVDSVTGRVFFIHSASQVISRGSVDGDIPVRMYNRDADSESVLDIALDTHRNQLSFVVAQTLGAYRVDANRNVNVPDQPDPELLLTAVEQLRAVCYDDSGRTSAASHVFMTARHAYWNVDGYTVLELTPAAGGSYQSSARAVVIDTVREMVYWTDDARSAIVRASSVHPELGVQTVVTGTGLWGLAIDVDAGQLYFSVPTTGEVKRVDLNGTNVEVVASGLTGARGLALRRVSVPAVSPSEDGGTHVDLSAASMIDVRVTQAVPTPLASSFDTHSVAPALVVGDTTNVDICTTTQALAVWCAAHCSDASESLQWSHTCRVPSFATVTGLASAPCEATATDEGQCAPITGFPHMFMYVRGDSEASGTDISPTLATEVSQEAHLSPVPTADTPMCGPGLRLGQRATLAARSCAHVLVETRACSGGLHTPPSGLYWIRGVGRVRLGPQLTFCDMETDGGGWTLVSPQGVAPIAPATAAVPGTAVEGYGVDVAGQAFNQVLLSRVSDTWCKAAFVPRDEAYSVGVGTSNASMVTFDASGALVVVPRIPSDPPTWDLDAATAADSVLTASPVGDANMRTGNTGVVLTLAESAAAMPLVVGAPDGCGGTVDVSVAVFVRDSGVAATETAQSIGTRTSRPRGYRLLQDASTTTSVTTAYSGLHDSQVCDRYAVEPQTARAYHPTHDSLAGDPSDPLPQRDIHPPVCQSPQLALSDAQLTNDVSMETRSDTFVVPSSSSLFGAARDCVDVLALGYGESGWYEVFPDGAVEGASPVVVYCDQDTAGGGWTLVFSSSSTTTTPPRYLPGLSGLVAESTQTLLALRDSHMVEASAAAGAAWAVVVTPEAWRVTHPGGLPASETAALVTLPGETIARIRSVKFGADASSLGDCNAAWVSDMDADAILAVHGRLCIPNTTAVMWADFQCASACSGATSLCTNSASDVSSEHVASDLLPGSRFSCSDSTQFTLAVRRQGVAARQPSAYGAADASRLAVQTGSLSSSPLRRAASEVSLPAVPQSCSDALRRHPDAKDGMYDIQPAQAPVPRRVFCDMTHGGWELCAVVQATLDVSDPTTQPMVSEWFQPANHAKLAPSWSVDCSGLLQVGAMVSISDSTTSAKPTGHSAVLQAQLQGTGGGWEGDRWQAAGRSASHVDLVGVLGIQVASQVAAFHLGAGTPLGGPSTTQQGSGDNNPCAAAGQLSGVQACGGGSQAGTFLGAPWRGQLAFWVRASHASVFASDAVPVRKPRTCAHLAEAFSRPTSGPAALWTHGEDAPPVFAECDMEVDGAGALVAAWTVVFASDASPGVHAATSGYLPGMQPLVATAQEARLAMSTAEEVSRVSDGDAWVAFPLPEEWRTGSPVAHNGAVDRRDWPIRTSASSHATGSLRWGRAGVMPPRGGADWSVQELCAAQWDVAPVPSVAAAMGRVCAAVPSSGAGVAWAGFGTPSPGSSMCGAGTAANISACDAGNHVFSIAVRHAAGVNPSFKRISEICPAGWTHEPGHGCFKEVASTQEFAETRALCSPGELVSITSAERNDVVAKYCHGHLCWLGASGDYHNTYTWLDGEEWGYENFWEDEPDIWSELCLAMRGDNFKWLDLPCTTYEWTGICHLPYHSSEVTPKVEPLPRSCLHLQQASTAVPPSGEYTVYPLGDVLAPTRVYCDMESDGGGWSVVLAAHPGDMFSAGALAGDMSQPGPRLPVFDAATTALMRDPRNEVLMAFRDGTTSVGSVAVGTSRVAFPMPKTWRTRHPLLFNGRDETVMASVEDAAASAATLRFGHGGFAGTGCGGGWDPTEEAFGRVCVVGTTAPLWAGFASLEPNATSTCGASSGGASPVACAGTWFTIAVRASLDSQAPTAGEPSPPGYLPPDPFSLPASCHAVHLAGATESGFFTVYPAHDVAGVHPRAGRSLGHSLPATCADVLRDWPTAPNGLYTLLPPTAVEPVQVFCDMANGGWLLCGSMAVDDRTPNVAVGLSASGDGTSARGRRLPGYSVDCSWALVQGASVAMSNSSVRSDAAVGSAVLISDAHELPPGSHR